MGKRLRKKIIINQHFQWKYTLSVLFVVLFSVGVTAFSISWLHLFMADDSIVCDTNGSAVLLLVLLSIVLVVVFTVRTIYFTHTIAGPVYKAQLVLNNAIDGIFDDHPVRFRDGDSFVSVASTVNSSIDKIKNAHLVEAHLNQFLGSVEQEDTKDLTALLDKIETLRENIRVKQ